MKTPRGISPGDSLELRTPCLTLTEIELSDAAGRGITVTEIAAMGQPIDATPESTAAFVGRALRGPLNTPVLIRHLGDFRRRFGDGWPGSGLGPAVRQFFENGGKDLYVVRIASAARGALLCLPALGSALVLRAVDPGSAERIRAAIDYDGIDPDDDARFNLTLQRIDPDRGLIADQEIHQGLGFLANEPGFVADVLESSSIARVEAPLPTHRPEATVDPDSRYRLTWVDAAEPGTDGGELTDYDLVGSEVRGTGLFALEQVERLDLVYLPSPGRGRDPGPTAVLAADRYCRRRGAMLIVDPSLDWHGVDEATCAVRALGYASPNICGYFPRLDDGIGAGGAIAGLLARLDRTLGPWQELDKLALSRGLVPALALDDADARTLRRAGLNAIVAGSARRAHVTGSTTLGRGSESQRIYASLPVRRTCLRIVNSIGIGTRWAVFETPDARLTARIRAQVSAYLYEMADLGALADDDFVVQCDAGVAIRDDQAEHGVTILVALRPAGSPTRLSLTIHQTTAGCRVTDTAFAPAPSARG